MFNKIFRPKWQHRKAEVRLVALRELAASDPILFQVARNDSEPSVRLQAMRRIEDLNSLFQLLAGEGDETVREACGKRLKRILAGQEVSLALEQRLQFLEQCAEEEMKAYVLQHAAEVELRRAALAAVSRPSLLAEVVLTDPSSELRLAALERIDRRATLERIVREARGKDKQVSRRAKEKLEAERTAELRPQRQAEICESVEALAKQGGLDLVAFRRLEDEWNSLLPAESPLVDERFVEACAAFAKAHTRVQAEAALSARQRELCERAEQLLGDVERDDVDLYGMESAITMLQRAWDSLEEDLPNLSSTLRERFNDALAMTSQRRAERIRQGEDATRLHSLLERLAQLTEDEAVSAESLQQLESEWEAAGGNHQQPHTAALCDHFAQLLQRAQRKIVDQGQAVQALQREYGALLGQLERALGDGLVQQATACRDKLTDREKRLTALGGRPSVQQQRRRKLANAKLRELRDWRRFGTDQAREDLLAQMVELQTHPLAPLKQAEAIKTLRAAWRDLDRKDGIAADSLWQNFEQAAEEAYTPCRDFYEEQARQREENLAARRHFIAELEKEYASVDWQQTNWAALDKRLQLAQKTWPTLGGVERSTWQEVNALFRQTLAKFEQHLAAHRESEKLRREALIRKVEALAEEPELQKALADTRGAQAAWRPDLSCPPRIEQALWRRFKAACDAVYDRQKVRVDKQRREEQVLLAQRERLCEQIEALLAGPDLQRSRVAELQQQWRECAGLSARRNKALEQRFEAALTAFRHAEEAALRRQVEAERQLLIQKSELCNELESLLFVSAQPQQIDRLVSAWAELSALSDTRLEQALSARYEHALEQLTSGAASTSTTAAAEENLARCQALCLQLEILAGVESPSEFAEARLAMQVELLAGAMTGQMTEAERQERMRQLLEEYVVIGPTPPEAHAVMQERIGKVLAAAS